MLIDLRIKYLKIRATAGIGQTQPGRKFLWKTTCQQVSTGNSLHTPKISTGEIFALVRYPQDKSWLSCVNRGFFN